MRILIKTADKFLWTLRVVINQLEKYWPSHPPVLVAGYATPDYPLPEGYKFYSIGSNDEFRAPRFSNALIKTLGAIDDELLLWLMDDFWLSRQVDGQAIEALATYMRRDNPNISRIDLTTDRLYAGNLVEVGPLGRLDLITNTPPIPYHFSFQAGIWRRTELLKYLHPDETPQETEINGTRRMQDGGAVVLGTRQAPMRYLIAVQGGKVAFDGGYQVPRVPFGDFAELESLGYLNGQSHS